MNCSNSENVLVFNWLSVYVRHPDNEMIDCFLVLCAFRALRQAVWDSWLGLSGLSGLAALAVAVESSRGPKNVDLFKK